MTLNADHLRILTAFRSFGSLTVRSFSHAPTIDGGDEFDRLPARILELRELGYVIETVMETTPKGKRHARYFLRGEATADEAPTGDEPDEPEAPAEDDGGLLLFDPAPAPARGAYEDAA